MNAPANATSPPSSQQPRISGVVCTRRATTYGFMKIPEPMMPPMTIMAASNRPSRRASPVGGSLVAEVFGEIACSLFIAEDLPDVLAEEGYYQMRAGLKTRSPPGLGSKISEITIGGDNTYQRY